MTAQTAKGLTREQREWVLERDSYECQMFRFHEGRWEQCGSRRNLEVHHILPQRWMSFHLPTRAKHVPTNLITLCRDCCHSGPMGIHPDMWTARRNYKNNNNSFKEAFEHRDELVGKGIPYWQTDWDWMLIRRARKLTARFSKKKKFPNPHRA